MLTRAISADMAINREFVVNQMRVRTVTEECEKF